MGWTTIDTKLAQGTSIEVQEYESEYKPAAIYNTHYYRLKMVDRDGSFDYSEVQALKETQAFEIQVAPNPFNDFITINVPGSHYQIYNSLGEIVFEAQSTQTEINLNTLSSGMYIIRSFDGSRSTATKIVKPKK